MFNYIMKCSINEISSIKKVDDETWYFTFSFSKGVWYRAYQSTFVGKVYSKDDSLTCIDIESKPNYFDLVISLFLVLTIGGIISNVLIYILRFIILVGVIFSYIYLYNRQTSKDLNEFCESLNLLTC